MSGKNKAKREKSAAKLARKVEKARAKALAADWADFDFDDDTEGDELTSTPETSTEPEIAGMPVKPMPILDEAEAAKRSVKARLMGYASAASLTPEERSAKARLAGLASAAKRREERARLGLPDPKPRRASLPQPTMLDLSDYIDEIVKRDPSKEWTQTALRSQAIAEMKLDLARDAFESTRRGDRS